MMNKTQTSTKSNRRAVTSRTHTGLFSIGIALIVLSAPASPAEPCIAASSDENHAAARQMATVMDAKVQPRGGDAAAREMASGSASNLCPGQWLTPFNDPGLANETIYALAAYEGDLYAGGAFTTAGGETVNHIARWNGESWSALGAGVNGIVRSMLAHNGSLYVGGHFTTAGGASANRIARWDGTSWAPIGDGFNNAVMALAEHDGSVIAGGLFTESGEAEVSRVARWDDGAGEWQALGEGVNRSVLALRSTGLGLVAGGHFSRADGEPAGRVAVWTGSEWLRLSGGFRGPVNAISTLDGVPVAGGAMHSNLTYTGSPDDSDPELLSGGDPTDRVLKLAEPAWQPLTGALPPTPNHSVNAMVHYNDLLHAAGKFTDVQPSEASPSVPANLVAQWDGENWQPLGDGLGGMYNGSAEAMVRYNGKLIVAGYFATAGTAPATSIAAWDAPPYAGPGDFNCDGVVNGADLLVLLSEWGECADPDDCPADLNGDGVVDGADLLILLSNWG